MKPEEIKIIKERYNKTPEEWASFFEDMMVESISDLVTNLGIDIPNLLCYIRILESWIPEKNLINAQEQFKRSKR